MNVRQRVSTVRVTAMFVMFMRMIARCGYAHMLMRTAHFNRHQIHLPVTHATHGDQRLRKALHLRRRATQNRCLQTMIMIEMHMHR